MVVFHNDAFDVMSPKFLLLHCLGLAHTQKAGNLSFTTRNTNSFPDKLETHLNGVRLFRVFVLCDTEAQRIFGALNQHQSGALKQTKKKTQL